MQLFTWTLPTKIKLFGLTSNCMKSAARQNCKLFCRKGEAEIYYRGYPSREKLSRLFNTNSALMKKIVSGQKLKKIEKHRFWSGGSAPSLACRTRNRGTCRVELNDEINVNFQIGIATINRTIAMFCCLEKQHKFSHWFPRISLIESRDHCPVASFHSYGASGNPRREFS